jgi:hypothetical protein
MIGGRIDPVARDASKQAAGCGDVASRRKARQAGSQARELTSSMIEPWLLSEGFDSPHVLLWCVMCCAPVLLPFGPKSWLALTDPVASVPCWQGNLYATDRRQGGEARWRPWTRGCARLNCSGCNQVVDVICETTDTLIS